MTDRIHSTSIRVVIIQYIFEMKSTSFVCFCIAIVTLAVGMVESAATHKHTHHHDHTKERTEDGVYKSRDSHHHDEDGLHKSEFDHESIIGSVKEAEEFDNLSPAEAKRRLAILVTQMDLNSDDHIDRHELKAHILRSFLYAYSLYYIVIILLKSVELLLKFVCL